MAYLSDSSEEHITPEASLRKQCTKYSFDADSYFIACYNILRDHLVFIEFFTDTAIHKDSLLPHQQNEYTERIETLRAYWQMIESSANFNRFSYMTSMSEDYFKRSINSQFFSHEAIGLFNNHSCNALPPVFQAYGGVAIEVTAHPSLFDEKEPLTNSHPVLKEFKFSIKVPFLFLVDVIIKEALNELKAFLRNKLEAQSLIKQEEIEPNSSKQKIINNDDSSKTKGSNKDSTQGQSTESKYEEMLKRIEEDSKPSSDFCYVLKLKSYEEFLYGEYSIGSYECVRKYVREFESAKLILFKKPLSETSPSLDHFPPIIFIQKRQRFTFFDLFQRYASNYPRNSALFRFDDTGSTQREQFLKKKESTQEELVKHTESGECDYPFELTIVSIVNLKALRIWLEDEEYMRNEIMLPNFTEFETKEEFEAQKVSTKLKHLFCCSKRSKDSMIPVSSLSKTMTMTSKASIDAKGAKPNSKAIELERIRKQEKEERAKRKKEMIKIRKSKKENDKYDIELNSMGLLKKQSESKMDKMTQKLKVKTFDERIEKKIKGIKPLFEPNSNVNGIDGMKADSKYHFPFEPVFIVVKVDLLYGSYRITSYETHFFLLNETLVCLNETVVFANAEFKFLISHLPRETRLGFTLIGYNKNQNESVELGSCQVPLYKDTGVMNSGRMKVSIWPFFQIDPKFNCCTSFQFKPSKVIHQSEEDKASNGDLSKEACLEVKFEPLKESNDIMKPSPQRHADFPFVKTQPKVKEKVDQSQYCYLFIDFPSFTKPLAHSPKSPASYRNFLLENSKASSNCFNKLYGTMIDDMKSLLSEWESFDSKIEANKTTESKAKAEDDSLLTIDKVELNLEHIGAIVKKDPLTKLSSEERDQVLICRDYLSTMPNSIEVFLRSVDWFNPCHVYIAHLYLKRWAKLKPEDAIIMLDSRFPDVKARQLAIKTLEEVSDDIIEMFILQLCQCLQYESYLLSPLADFLIKKSLSNPQLIGNKFFWSAKVGSENFLFRDRLAIIITQWLMLAGARKIEMVQRNLKQKEQFKELTRQAKETYASCRESNKVEVVKASIVRILDEWNDDKSRYGFVLPIHPSYYIGGYTSKEVSVFDSKMVPIKIPCRSSDGSTLPVMFKIGDDLRQDVLILQILKIMDKMWLENDLDLKISTYNVCPMELKCGFIEFVNARVIEGVQQSKSGGAMDQELLYNHLMQLANKSEQTETKLLFINQIDNFIRSLAGYSVATGVLGIADRHPGNVMLKENGIFFHIDYGHILGHFKTKFGIQRERSAFLMTPDMAYVYIKTNNEEKFKSYCVQAYNILRHNAQRLLNLFITMTSAGMPELTGMNEVKYFRDMLSLDKKNDEDAGNYFLTLLKDSKNEKYRLFDNMIHNLKHA